MFSEPYAIFISPFLSLDQFRWDIIGKQITDIYIYILIAEFSKEPSSRLSGLFTLINGSNRRRAAIKILTKTNMNSNVANKAVALNQYLGHTNFFGSEETGSRQGQKDTLTFGHIRPGKEPSEISLEPWVILCQRFNLKKQSTFMQTRTHVFSGVTLIFPLLFLNRFFSGGG